MNELKIGIVGLKSGKHQFDFQVDDSFFAAHESSMIQHASLAIRIDLEKSDTMMIAHFGIKGKVELECDRSLEKFWHKLQSTDRLVYKYGETDEELTDEIMVISRGSTHIDFSQPIYEFATLAIPQRKIKPELDTEDAGERDDLKLVYSSAPSADAEETTENDTDPKWLALKKLFDN